MYFSNNIYIYLIINLKKIINYTMFFFYNHTNLSSSQTEIFTTPTNKQHFHIYIHFFDMGIKGDVDLIIVVVDGNLNKNLT